MTGGRRRVPPALVIALIALVVLVAAAAVAGGGQSDQNDPSSRSPGQAGGLALFDWLRDGLGLGDQVTRVSGDFRLDHLDLLIVEQPTRDFTDADTAAVDAFVRAGGELVLALDRSSVAGVQGLLARFHARPVAAIAASTVARPDQPLDPGGRVGQVPLSAGAIAFADDPGATSLLSIDEGTVMVGAGAGRGRAFVLGSAYPLSNAGLRPDGGTRSDAYALVLSLLERARGGRIGFDEVHHGEGAGQVGAAAVFDGPVGIAAGLAALVLLLHLALSGRRLGRPLPVGDPSRVPSAGDFVTAMAQLYERSRLRGPVAAGYADELKARVSAATGIDRRLDDDAFCAALRGFGEDRAAEVAGALRRARGLAGGRPDDAALLRLARLIDEVERTWTAGGVG